jgi:hypothetical protein
VDQLSSNTGETHPEQTSSIAHAGMPEAVKRALGLNLQDAPEWHPLMRTHLYRRLATWFGKLHTPLTFNHAEREIHAADIRITVHMRHIALHGKRESLQAAGFFPAWFPGAPGQKKYVGDVTASLFGAQRKLKLRATSARGLDVFADMTTEEIDELWQTEKSVTEVTRSQSVLANAQDNAHTQIARLPASGKQFLDRSLGLFGALVESAIAGLAVEDGGYKIAPDDLDDITFALRDALNVLRRASVRFDERKRQAEILEIVDKHVDAALPVCECINTSSSILQTR